MTKLEAPTIETVPLEQLKPWDRNPRKNHAVDAISRSIETFGYLNPIIVQKGTYRILAGHGRLEALRRRGVAQVPVVVAAMTDEEADLYTLADNKIQELSGWDVDLLSSLVHGLYAKEIDLSIAGFDDAALQELLADGPLEATEDEVVEPVQEAVTQYGDLWQLGDHRIKCSDSTSEFAYKAILDLSHPAALVFTDPPYGVDYKAKKFDSIKNDDLKGEHLVAFLAAAFGMMKAFAAHDAAFYIWHASSTREEFSWAMKVVGLVERQCLIWVKPSIVLGHADYQWQHEPCFYASREATLVPFYGDRTQATIWQVGMRQGATLRYQLGAGVLVSTGEQELYVTPAAPRGRKIRRIRVGPNQAVDLVAEISGGDCWFVQRDPLAEHPTQKPVELARRAIENSSRHRELVLDPFLGSGSTLIACELTGRHCRGIELTPQYVDIAIKRWQRLTGKKAINLSREGVVVA